VIIGLLLTSVMLLFACNPKETTAPATTTTKPPTQTTTTTKPSSDKPQYGGTFNIVAASNIDYFGPAVSNRFGGAPFMWEQITTVDRTTGPAGSGKVDYKYGPTSMTDVIGCLAEKWATPTTDTWVLDIRKGVHFAFNPNSAAHRLVGGREMTAEDVAYSIEWLSKTPTSAWYAMESGLAKNCSFEITGPWQVTVHTPVSPNTAYLWCMGGGGSQFIWPKEWIDKYGLSNEWYDQIGTGPYYIADWVNASVATYTKNKNYWDTNPCGPGKGDALPYMDGIKYSIVPDMSTQLSALRTGKADYIYQFGATSRDDALSLLGTNADMKYIKAQSDPLQVGMRLDKSELPFKDIRVRHALMLATDQPGILKDYYAGEGELLASPARSLYPSVYTPLEQLPESTRELYGYNPEKAKQLLAEAGYPDGFQTKMVCISNDTNINMAEIIKEQWAKVGVEVEIQPKETGVFMGLWSQRNYEELMLTNLCGGNADMFVRYSFGYFRSTNAYNISHVDDPVGSDQMIEAAFLAQEKVINIDFAACDKLMKDLIPYELEQTFLIPMPAPFGYRLWQPWIKNYYGEGSDKYYAQYMWIDRDMKESMTGRR